MSSVLGYYNLGVDNKLALKAIKNDMGLCSKVLYMIIGLCSQMFQKF